MKPVFNIKALMVTLCGVALFIILFATWQLYTLERDKGILQGIDNTLKQDLQQDVQQTSEGEKRTADASQKLAISDHKTGIDHPSTINSLLLSRISALNALVASLLVLLLGSVGILGSKRILGAPLKSFGVKQSPNPTGRLSVVGQVLHANRALGLVSETLSRQQISSASCGELNQALAELKSTAAQIENIVTSINDISE